MKAGQVVLSEPAFAAVSLDAPHLSLKRQQTEAQPFPMPSLTRSLGRCGACREHVVSSVDADLLLLLCSAEERLALEAAQRWSGRSSGTPPPPSPRLGQSKPHPRQISDTENEHPILGLGHHLEVSLSLPKLPYAAGCRTKTQSAAARFILEEAIRMTPTKGVLSPYDLWLVWLSC